MPGIAVSRATSWPRIARMRSAGSMPDSTASASFGPIPLMAIRRSNSVQLERRREPEERDDVFAHVRVDAQRRPPCPARRARRTSTAAPARRSRHRRRRRSGGWELSRRVVPVEARVRSRADSSRHDRHVRRRDGFCRRRAALAARRSVPVALCTWQIATASASAASCGDGSVSRPSSSLTIC